MRPPNPITALACLTLGACSTTPPAAAPIPANLTAPCEPLTPLAKGADYGDLLSAAIDAAGKYAEACARHGALVELVAH